MAFAMKSTQATWLTLTAILVVLLVAVLRLDLMLAGTAVIAGVALVYPGRRDGSCYCPYVLHWTAAGALLTLAAEAADLSGLLGGVFYGGVSVGWLLILLTMSVLALGTGLMIAAALVRYTALEITERWVIIFAGAFAIAVSAVYLFPLFVELYCDGFAVFNEDVRLVTDKVSDRILMAPVLAAIAAVVPAGFVLRHGLRRRKPKDLVRGPGDD